MYIADMLSHAYLHEEPSTSKGDYQLFQLSQEAQVYKEIEEIDPAKHVWLSVQGLENLREATIHDDTLNELARIIRQGWPDLKQNVPMSIRAFWPYRDELVVHGQQHCLQRHKSSNSQKHVHTHAAKDAR